MDNKPNLTEHRTPTNVIPFQVDATFYFARAVHYLDRHDLKNAVKNFRKAVEFEPDNPVNHCNLAGVLSELGDFEQSNRILQNVLQNIDPDLVECYFYMANNHANMGEYELAEEYVTRYLELDPNGEFAPDAEEMMQILISEFGGGDVMKERKQQQEEEQRGRDLARQLIEQGKFLEATEYLERAIDEAPESTAPRNNLSLAYYYLGKLDRAVEVAQEVLQRDASNVHALCNLAVFYQHLGRKEELQKILSGLRKLYPIYSDHTYKLATTMGILGEHATAYRLFKQVLRWSEVRDVPLLHCVAAAACNLGFYEKAKRLWEEIQTMDQGSDIPAFYLKKVSDALAAGKRVPTISYQYHIPFADQFKLMKEQLQTGKLGAWRNDPLVRSSLFWALQHGDLETKMQVIQTFALIADKEVEHALREFIKQPDEIDQLKRLAIYVLRHMGAEGPFEANLDREDVLLRVQSMPQDDLLTCKPEWQEVLDSAVRGLNEYDSEEAPLLARDLWTEYLNRVFHAPPRIVKTASWAAALCYVVLKKLGLRITQTEIAKTFDVTTGSISKISRQLIGKEEPLEEL